MKTNLLVTAIMLSSLLVACKNAGQKTNTKNKEIEIVKTDSNMNTTSKRTIQLTRAEFLTKVANIEENPDKWVYLGDKPCIIDFYADWCGPCKMIAPILEELAGEYADEIYIYKVDTEAEQQLAGEFGIRSIPSLLFVPMDEAPQMAQGALPKDAFKQAIDEVLLNKQ